MKTLFTAENVAGMTGLEKMGLAKLARPLMRMVGLEDVNALYTSLFENSTNGQEFVEEFFKTLSISCVVSDKDLAKIPREGAFITVSNHPFGAVDGLLLMKLLLPVRPDFKVLANFLLQHVEPLRDIVIPVNPFESHREAKSSITGMKNSLRHLSDGSPLGIFPAGEVSSYQPALGSVADREWQTPALKLIKKAKVPVLPIYFEGSNSPLFHILGLLNPSLRTATLAKEMFNKRNSTLTVRIGKPIIPKEYESFENVEQAGRYLRARVYALGSGLKVKKFFKDTPKVLHSPKEIAPPIAGEILAEEIASLPQEAKVASQGGFDLYLAPAQALPNVLLEIGRLREITFRAVGEGSLKNRDLDEYDTYYEHLFLWDSTKKSLAGAYRLGRGNRILAAYGKKGFYTSSLFKFDDALLPVLEHAVELGRSFIIPDYQRHRLPLFMLWQGILAFLLRNPNYRYLFGPVSISNDYSKASQHSIVEFIKKHHFKPEIAHYVTPKKPFSYKDPKLDTELLLNGVTNLASLGNLIGDIEPSGNKLPILLMKYMKQNASIVGFNVDPLFNNALDGLMVLDLCDVPADILRTLARELGLPADISHPALAVA